MSSSSNSGFLSQCFRSVSHSDSWSLVSDKPRIGWRSQRECPIAGPKQRDALLLQSQLVVTPQNDPKGPRNRVRAAPVNPSTGRRAAGASYCNRAKHMQSL